VKFDTDNVHMMPLSDCNFRENPCNESHTLLMGVNYIAPVFVHFSLNLDIIGTVDVHKNLSHDCEFHVNWHSESCTLFLDDIRYKRSEHNAVEHLLVS
jgi:hypothetical protein